MIGILIGNVILSRLASGAIAMSSKMTSVLFVFILSIILGLSFGVFEEPGWSSESVEEERTWCIRQCKERYGVDVMMRGGGSVDLWRLYFKCIDDCERKFWKEWQKKMDEIEKE